MNYHDIKVNGRIAEIFQSYDNDNSGSIDSKEFTGLISDLHFLHSGERLLNPETLAGSIAEKFRSNKRDYITLEEFILEVKRDDSPFGDLKENIINDSYEELLRLRKRLPFRPTYEYQKFQEPMSWSGLESNMNTKMARIPNPMQCCFQGPDFRILRPYVDRKDTVAIIKNKIIESDDRRWIKKELQKEKISSNDIDLVYDSEILSDDLISEDIDLYFIHKNIKVIIHRRVDHFEQSKSTPSKNEPQSVFQSTPPNINLKRYDEFSDRLLSIENPIREFLRKTQPLDKLVNAKDTFPTKEEVGDTNFNDLVQRYTTLKEKLTAIETMFK